MSEEEGKLLHDRLMALERTTDEDRRDATRHRHDFRAEVSASMYRLGEDMHKGLDKIDTSIIRLQDRLDHSTEWRLKIAGTLIMVLLALVGFLSAKLLGWV